MMANSIYRFFIFIVFIAIVLPTTFYGYNFFSREFVSTNRYPEVAQSLMRHVKYLSYDIGGNNILQKEQSQGVVDYIVNEFESYGYKVRIQSFKTKNGQARNIIAKKDWKIESEFVIGAHYDTMDNPGADDNASGIAVLLETAKAYSGIKLDEPVEFVAFANEEPPYFRTDEMGSRVYVDNLLAEERSIKAAIILEMVGYYKDTYFSQEYPVLFGLFFPNKGNFVALVGNNDSADLTKRIKGVLYNETNLPVEHIAFDFTADFLDYSDHESFWRKGFNAIMITDTSFFRNKNYHMQTDTYDTLDYERMSEIVIGLKRVVEAGF